MLRWFKSLSPYRKVVLFVAGGMLTLVFDAFVAHYRWNNGSMKWNQTIPIIYGLVAFVALGVVALLPLDERRRRGLGRVMGALGMLVGAAGFYFHASSLLEGIDEETTGFVAIGKLLAAGPPLFAPVAFAGVGLLLVALPSLFAAPRQPPAAGT
jgi:4-amino-4-deoxy-L-arabinose transferase-like glycosyltransferase